LETGWTCSDFLVLCTRGEIFAVWAEAHAADVQVARFTGGFVHEHTIRRYQTTQQPQINTHQVFCPVLVSYTCAVRLHPVAKYLPSAEKRTQHTTLDTHQPRSHAHERTHLSCMSVWTKLTSSTRLTLGLNTTHQSLPSFLSSGGTLCKSMSSGNPFVCEPDIETIAFGGCCCCCSGGGAGALSGGGTNVGCEGGSPGPPTTF
jgi:hypothetical protein